MWNCLFYGPVGKTVKEVQVENGVVTNGGNLFLLAKNEKILILANRISIVDHTISERMMQMKQWSRWI